MGARSDARRGPGRLAGGGELSGRVAEQSMSESVNVHLVTAAASNSALRPGGF